MAATILMLGTLLLTGSLAGIASAVLGLLMALVVVRPFSGQGLRQAILVAIAILVSVLLFGIMAVANVDGEANLGAVLWDRIAPILDGGVRATNRNYIYEYVENTPFPVLGWGYGIPNLIMARDFGQDLVGSFLNWYVCTAYSAGYIGLGLLIAFLATPVIRALRGIQSVTGVARLDIALIMAAYFSWLMRYAMCTDEPVMMSAVAYAMVAPAGVASLARSMSIHQVHKRRVSATKGAQHM
jgi:hypothetical protein